MARNGQHVARRRIRFRHEPTRPLAVNAAQCARDMPSPKAARGNPDERSSDEDQRPPTWTDDEETGRDAARPRRPHSSERAEISSGGREVRQTPTRIRHRCYLQRAPRTCSAIRTERLPDGAAGPVGPASPAARPSPPRRRWSIRRQPSSRRRHAAASLRPCRPARGWPHRPHRR